MFCDAGQALKQHWAKASRLLEYVSHITIHTIVVVYFTIQGTLAKYTSRLPNAGLMVGQRGGQ